MRWRFLEHEHLPQFVSHVADTDAVFAPVQAEGRWHVQRCDAGSLSAANRAPYRVVESLKTFLFAPVEGVGGDIVTPPRTVVLGVKNCDLLALALLDKVFLEGAFTEPFYAARRAQTLIIADDCSACLPSCFCVAIGHPPYPDGIADVILSPVTGGDLVAAGTERGEALLAVHAQDCPAATAAQLAEQAKRRAGATAVVQASLRAQGIALPEDLGAALQAPWPAEIWEKVAATCVECGACNFVCPSCHCFFLRDVQPRAGAPQRTRVWDACLSENFSRVAGGHNPNKRREARLRHRLERKFIAPLEAQEGYACTGCGRCVDACLGHLDIRTILHEVAHARQSVPTA